MTTEDNDARDQARAQLESIKEMVAALDLADANADDDAMEEARQHIQEAPLSVEVRGGWYSPGGDQSAREPEQFQILLCWGGPAVRIIGDLYADGAPANPYIQYQDWGTPWTDYPLTSDDRATVIEYCQQFYFGG